MAMIHETLYEGERLGEINVADYIQSLAPSLFNSYRTSRGDVTLEVQSDDIFFKIDVAVPLGLVINELISNALTHAFPDDRDGTLRLEVRRKDGGQISLIVSDTGIGFPEELDFRDSPSLGLRLVNSLVRQLNGTIALDRSRGTTFNVTFAPG
jgi:two-component sensor histidine kinase